MERNGQNGRSGREQYIEKRSITCPNPNRPGRTQRYEWMPGAMLPINVVAEILSLHERTVRRMCAEGKIPGALMVAHRWRVRGDDLHRWLQSLENRSAT